MSRKQTGASHKAAQATWLVSPPWLHQQLWPYSVTVRSSRHSFWRLRLHKAERLKRRARCAHAGYNLGGTGHTREPGWLFRHRRTGARRTSRGLLWPARERQLMTMLTATAMFSARCNNPHIDRCDLRQPTNLRHGSRLGWLVGNTDTPWPSLLLWRVTFDNQATHHIIHGVHDIHDG